MKITFRRNHNGETLVLVDGKSVALTKDCEGYEENVEFPIISDDGYFSKVADNIADRIIADYKEHYDFPTQGESHMHDCITSALSDDANLSGG